MNNAQQTILTPEQALKYAEQFIANGQFPEAEKLCRDILAASPTFHPATYQLGIIATRVGKMQMAADLVSKAASQVPQNLLYQKTLIDIFRLLGQYDRAIAAGGRATKLAPEDGDAHYLLGLVYADSGRPEKALEYYRHALGKTPSHDRAANNIGTMLEKNGDEKTAEEFYERAIKANPKNPQAQNNLGALLSARGDLERAGACFLAAIDADPFFIHAHFNLSTLKKYTPDDPHLAAMEKLVPHAPDIPVDARLRLWFSLGKAWEDIGRYDDSFAAYARGNSIQRALIQYDEKIVDESTLDIGRRFNKALTATNTAGFSDETPIFIVGMPRSGTTLIEQILSSHSAVFGAGELQDLCDSIKETWKIAPGISYVDHLKNASTEELQTLGQSYIEKIRRLNGSAPRITDKMPGNYFYVGLIHKILPNAKIIHCMRAPMDTCFSNYSRLFKESMPFTYNLEELGRYWRRYDSLMQHWKNILPDDAILDVRYEDVVADLEGQTRRLLDYCGLPWEDGCLAFHQNKRLVKTASIAQVRQPIYQSSVARWEHFARHLEPLHLALGKA